MMYYQEALRIADDLRNAIEPGCVAGHCQIVGSLRRKKVNVHDIEILALPLQEKPKATFGHKEVLEFKTQLDQILYRLEFEGRIRRLMGGEKMKKYAIRLSHYGMENLNEFKVEFYVITPPAQWGVGMVIRTGPGSDEDHFSRYCVTNQSAGGALPDGYKVKHLGVWKVGQLDSKNEPRFGESPLVMPDEQDFFDFLGLKWISPSERHAPR